MKKPSLKPFQFNLNRKGVSMKSRSVKLGAFFCTVLLVTACGKVSFDTKSSTELASTTGGPTQAQIRVAVKIYDGNNNTVYNDANSSSSLVLKSGQSYNLVLDPSATLAGAAYALELKQIDDVNATTKTLALKAGSNSLSIPTQGYYSMKLAVSAPKMLTLTKFYSASVTCQNPTFTANSLNASSIAVSAAGASNMYNYSAAGITAGANGQAPYTCAWDPTGSGIVDTGFKDCATAVAEYSNYVANRNIAVVVKDSCGMAHSVSAIKNLPYTVPAIGNGNVFIAGTVSNASGIAINDKRVDGVEYLATNPGGDVTSSYGSGTFTIKSSKNYQMPSSVPFGMNISISGITGNLDLAAGTGSLNASAATIKSISYSTDQAGDSAMPLSFSGKNCTLSNQGVKVLFINGTPCAPGETGSGKGATVEFYGNYNCTGLSTTGATINISGSFDGLSTLVDSCNGGGGGGGGVPRLEL